MADQSTPPPSSNSTPSEPWLFAAAVLAMLVLGVLLFAALHIVSGVFQQARTGALEALLIQSAATGVIAMASIQAVRTIVPIRSWFHRESVKVWLRRADDELKKPANFEARMTKRITLTPYLTDYIRPETTEELILHNLLQLTTAEGGDRVTVSRAFFDLPLEQLCGQISAGAERAIVDPKTNGPILLRLANAAGEEDVLAFFEAHQGLEQLPAPGPERDERTEKFMRARASVEERVRRSIDCLQIESGFYWRRRLRIIAVMLAAALGFTAALSQYQFLASGPTAIASGIVGGFFAMLARDLTAIVERLRRVP